MRTFADLGQIGENAAGEPRPRPQLGLWFWHANSLAHFTYLQAPLSCSGVVNLSRFCNPKLDARMEQAARARGPEAIDLWRRVETALASASADRSPPQLVHDVRDRRAGRQLPGTPAPGPAARTALGQMNLTGANRAHLPHRRSRARRQSASHNQVAAHDAAALGTGGTALVCWWRSAGARTLSAPCNQRTPTGRRPGQDSNLRPMA